ncbi:MAG: hypothetical protein P9X24_02515 [Candidatus Hatepunaea meridiana]|nr:hypothetical protein [Candidatus Hatepunaea meridiana]
MTALIYQLEPNQVSVAMDTLSLNEDKKPLLYTSKIFLLPHLGGLMCGTGIVPFVVNWYIKIQTGIIAKDIEYLGNFTPKCLRELWHQCADITERYTSTIYHFGYSWHDNSCKGFAFRSTNNFALEELQYSISVKPALAITEIAKIKELPRDIIKIMYKQKEEDDKLPFEQRLGIGGEIHFAHLTPHQTTIQVCHRFNDYESNYKQMCRKLP